MAAKTKKAKPDLPINLIGMAIHLRKEYPIPANWGSILGEMGVFLNLAEDKPDKLIEIIDTTTQVDIYRCLIRLWKRGGWVWDNNVGAVLLEADEEATFDDDDGGCITLAKGKGGSTMVVSLAHGEKHPRVVWF